MKKIITTIICAIALTACDKVYINGELDGMWRVSQVEYTDSTCQPTDIFYSFQRHMTQISKHYEEEIPMRFIGNLTYRGDIITMSGFRKYLEEDRVCSPEELKMFHLHSDSTIFTIEKLDDEILIMKNDVGKYILRKW